MEDGLLGRHLAQWAEGDENPALRPALRDWLSANPPVGLNLLQGGFTKLKSSIVPAAYAQSLFAAEYVLENFGFSDVRKYFNYLAAKQSKEEAFKNGFGMSEKNFEQKLGVQLQRWSAEL